MRRFQSCAVTACCALLTFGLPALILAGELTLSDRMSAVLGLGSFAALLTGLASAAFARVCAAFAAAPRYGFLALTLRGTIAGLAASFITMPLPDLFHFDGGIYIVPLLVGPPVGIVTVITLHLVCNRDRAR